MRINAANDIDAAAWVDPGSPRVRMRLGWQHYTATADEALELGRQLVEAAGRLAVSNSDREERPC